MVINVLIKNENLNICAALVVKGLRRHFVGKLCLPDFSDFLWAGNGSISCCKNGHCVLDTATQCGPLLGRRRRLWPNIGSISFLLDHNHQIRDVDPMLVHCWTDVVDDRPTMNQPWVDVSCLVGGASWLFARNCIVLWVYYEYGAAPV